LVTISIIIVNYRSGELVVDCLHSVYRETIKTSFEVIVVDNHSEDQSEELILGAFPGLKWIQMGYNAGFARANNEGIRRSSGQIVLLLNPDTLVENNAIDRCCELFQHSGYIACGVQLINPDRTPQIAGNYFMVGGLNHLLPLPYLGNFLSKIGNALRVKSTNVPDSNSIVEVDWISGAFLMVKKSALTEAGLMDEDFFLYAEEAEWCYRLGMQGKLCLFGQIKVLHLQGESANKAFGSGGKGYYNLYDRKGLQIMLSNFVRIRKQFGIIWFLIHLVIYIFEIPFFVFGISISRMFLGPEAKYSFSDFRHFSKNMLFILLISPKIIRNAPHFYKVL
jgi:GT2 family glycosyltransferase